MSDTVIQVENLAKRYILAHQAAHGGARYKRFSDVLVSAAKAPFRSLRKRGQSTPEREEFWALHDVSFEIQRGEVVGIIGRNGAGKSTLLKILSRITEPTSGSVEIEGRVASLLEVGTGFHPELTGRENIYLNGAILGMTRREIKKKFDEIVAFAEVEKFLDTPVRFYSSGMYVRLAFAVAAHLEPEILIVDEVLAVGDAQFQKKCLGKIHDVSTKEGRTVLFVSHNMGAIQQLCTRAIFLNKGQIKADGTIENVVDEYLSFGIKSGPFDASSVALRQGSGKVRIIAVRILNQKGEISNDFSIGSDLIIEFDLKMSQPVSAVKIGARIATIDGINLANMVDVDSGFNLEQLREKETVRIILRDMRFYPGGYVLSFWIGTPDSIDAYDILDDCIEFNILDGGKLTSRILPRTSGLLFLTPEWERIESY